MSNKYGKNVSEVLFKNFVGDQNPSEPRSKILEEPKMISQETTQIKNDIDSELSGSNDAIIDGVVGYRDLRFWYGKYSNETKSFIAITNIKDKLLTVTPNKKIIDKIEIANSQVDIPIIKYMSVTESGELFGIWKYNNKIHFFRLVHFTDQIGNPTLVNIYPIINTDVETVVVAPNEVTKGYVKFSDYDLIDITRDQIENGLFSFAIWKDDGVNDRKIRFILLDTSDLQSVVWMKNEDVNPSHVEGSLGTDFNGVSSLALKINKKKFDNSMNYDNNKILGSIWFATKSGVITTTPKILDSNYKENWKEKMVDISSTFPLLVKEVFFNTLIKQNLISIKTKTDKIKNEPNITNFKYKKLLLKTKFITDADRFGSLSNKIYPINLTITNETLIQEILDSYQRITFKYTLNTTKKTFDANTTRYTSKITKVELTDESLDVILDFKTPDMEIMHNVATDNLGAFAGDHFKCFAEISFELEYEYTQNITTNSVNTASQLLISERDDKKQNTLFYDLAQNISNPILDSNKAVPFNYLNAYYPVKTNQTWQIWDFNGKRGTNYDTPSTAKLVNDNSIWPNGNLLIGSILDEDFGTSVVGSASKDTTGIQSGSLGLNIYDGDGNGEALGVAETNNTEFQEIKYIVGNREENIMFWNAYNNDFSQKINYMQIYPNSLSPYTLTPFKDFFKTTVIDRVSVRDGEDFEGTKFDRAITNANVSNNTLSITTIANIEDLNDNDNDKLFLHSKTNEKVLEIDTTNYQNKDRTQKVEINVSTTFKYKINGIEQNIPSVALARLHNVVQQDDLDHLQIKKGLITFDDNTTKEFVPFKDTTWEVFPDEITGQTSLLIKFGLVQTDTNKKATKIQLFSKKDDLLNEIDLTTFPCTQSDWTNKFITIEFSLIVEI